jgi:hypothetical protein
MLRAMRTHALLLAAATAAPLLLASRAQAAVTLVVQRGADRTDTIALDNDKMRMDNGAKGESFIIDGAGKRTLIIKDREKTWSEITEADSKRFADMMQARRAMMQDRLKQLPPDQRQRMEQMMGGSLDAPKASHTLKFEKMGQKKSVNGFSCEMYRVLEEDGSTLEEDCIAPWSASVVQKSDFAGLRKYAEEMAKLSSGMGAGNGHEMFERFDKYPGFPVTRHPLKNGGEDEQLKSAKRGAIPASTFAAPAGYTKKDLQLGQMGAGAPHGNFRPLPQQQ